MLRPDQLLAELLTVDGGHGADTASGRGVKDLLGVCLVARRNEHLLVALARYGVGRTVLAVARVRGVAAEHGNRDHGRRGGPEDRHPSAHRPSAP